jgi:DNA-binding NtrC family response regulator
VVGRAVTQAKAVPARRETTRASASTPRQIVGNTPRMIEVYKLLAKASASNSNVLIVGESGTGKEMIAREIHANSTRHKAPFVTINCGALAENLLESELFGHVRGAFTGAIANKLGLFEVADGGTIFLDEIGDVDPRFQVKLLRVLQEGEFKPVGTNETRKVNVRLITATHRDLDTFIGQGRFREDLYYRIKVVTIRLPPLREHLEDLPDMVSHFVAHFSETSGKRNLSVARETMACLQCYRWPGNVRELEHAIERAIALANTSVIYPEDLPPEIRGDGAAPKEAAAVEPGASCSLETALDRAERSHILRVMELTRFNKCRAAAMLGIDRATLYRKAQRHGIPLSSTRIQEQNLRA